MNRPTGEAMRVGRQTVHITRPQKVLFPEDDIAVPRTATKPGWALRGKATRQFKVIAIPADGEFYIGRDKVAQADIPTRVRNILKDKPAPEQVVYIKSGKLVKYGTVVEVIDSIRDAGFDRIGLVAEKEKPGAAGGGQ